MTVGSDVAVPVGSNAALFAEMSVLDVVATNDADDVFPSGIVVATITPKLTTATAPKVSFEKRIPTPLNMVILASLRLWPVQLAIVAPSYAVKLIHERR